jgi:hypothetical protein
MKFYSGEMLKILKDLLYPLLFLIGLIIFLICMRNKQQEIVKNGNIAEGIVFDVSSGGKNGFLHYYSYQVGHRKYVDKFKFKGYSVREIRKKKYQELIGAKFIVYYDKNKPQKNVISKDDLIGTDSVLREFYLNKIEYGEKLALDFEFLKHGTSVTGLITDCYWNKSQRKHSTKFEYNLDGNKITDSVDFEARKDCAYTKNICLGKYFEFRFSKRDTSINLADFRELRKVQ